MRVVGRLPLARGPRTDCDQPLQAVCRDCDHSEEWRCDTYGCGPCGETKRRRLMRVIEQGAGGHIAAGRHGYFLTVTAPGVNDTLAGTRASARPVARSAPATSTG